MGSRSSCLLTGQQALRERTQSGPKLRDGVPRPRARRSLRSRRIALDASARRRLRLPQLVILPYAVKLDSHFIF